MFVFKGVIEKADKYFVGIWYLYLDTRGHRSLVVSGHQRLAISGQGLMIKYTKLYSGIIWTIIVNNLHFSY